jgi:hypothetical protein
MRKSPYFIAIRLVNVSDHFYGFLFDAFLEGVLVFSGEVSGEPEKFQ